MRYLPPSHRTKVYECISKTLLSLLEEIPDDEQCKPARDLTDVNSACADFKERWKERNSGPIMRLPAELLVDCFRPLGLGGRISVSHVISRTWRRIALSDKMLWSSACVSNRTLDNTTMLTALLSRSHPMPFQLTWEPCNWYAFKNSGEDIMDIVAQNVDRFQSILTTNIPPSTIFRLFDYVAPLLQHLIIDNGYNNCAFPRNWGAIRAPCLQRLTVGEVSIPDKFEPLPSVREFRGYMPLVLYHDTGDHGIYNLFEMFPNLVSLDLSEVTLKYLSQLPDLPPSVVHLTLRAPEDGRSVNFSSFIADHVDTTVRKLVAQSASGIVATIDAFAAKVQTWSLKVEPFDDLITLQEDDGICYSLFTEKQAWWRTRAAVAHNLHQVTSMTVPMEALMDLARGTRVPWDRNLPSLTSLRLLAETDQDVYRRHSLLATLDTAYAPVQAAQLETLDFRIFHGGLLEFVSTIISGVMPLLLSYSRPRLDSMAIEARWASDLRDLDLSALARLAHRVQITDCADQAVVVAFVDGELDTRAHSTHPGN